MRLDKKTMLTFQRKPLKGKVYRIVINLRTCQFDSNMYSIENL